MAFVLGLRERKKLATRQALGYAALRLAVRHGVDGVLVDDIAAAAGVSPRTFNNYFASKQEAMCSPAVDRAHRIADRLRERPASDSLWAAVVQAVLAEYDDSPTPDPEWTAGVRLVTTEPELQGEYLKARVALQYGLVRCIADRTGADLATDLYPHVLAGAVAAALDVATSRWINADPPIAPLPVFRDALRQLTLLPGELPADVPSAHTLTVPGATLYYEVRGSGPLLLLIPPGSGVAATYAPLAAALAERFTVVSYTRRGFTGSPADAVPADRLGADVADAAALLAQFGDDPALVFGSSSGAIVALALLGARPERVRGLIAHEPPLFALLPDAAEHFAFLAGVHELSQRAGAPAAMIEFLAGVGLTPPPAGPRPAGPPPGSHANLAFWMEHELRQYPSADLDLDALAAHSDRLCLAVGADSTTALPALPNHTLATRLAVDTTEYPGGHIGFTTTPTEFAAALTASATRL